MGMGVGDWGMTEKPEVAKLVEALLLPYGK